MRSLTFHIKLEFNDKGKIHYEFSKHQNSKNKTTEIWSKNQILKC